MKRCSLNHKWIALGLSCIFMLSFAILPAQAARRSPGLAITLLASGVGLQVGSTFLHASAQKTYEDYLSAAIQTDIQSHKDAVIARQNASVIMSRVGYGCIGLAVILSIINQLDTPSTETAQLSQIRNNATVNTRYPIGFTASPMSLGNRILKESQMVGFRPHFDFQKQSASLQFLYRF